MPPALPATRFAAGIAWLLGLIARHGHRRGVPGPIVVMAWQLARHVGAQVGALLGRIEAGTLRRFPTRRPPIRGAIRKRPPPSPRRAFGWLVALIPEAAQGAGQMDFMLQQPGVSELLEAAPQLRRALRPLCRALGIRPPRAETSTSPDCKGPDRAAPALIAAVPRTRPPAAVPPPITAFATAV